MSSGAITLQCPQCGGVFLTLQHSGAVEICPHCAAGAPRASFTATSAPVGTRPRSELPQMRSETASVQASHTSASTPAAPPRPLLEPPFPQAALPQTAFAAQHAPSSALPAHIFVHAAPTTHEVKPRPVADSAPAPHAPPASPPRINASVIPTAAPIFQSQSWPPHNVAAAAAPSPPVWPGIDRDELEEAALPFTFAATQREINPVPAGQKEGRRGVPWSSLVILMMLFGGVGWLAWQKPQPIVIPQGAPPPAPAPVAEAGKKSAPPAPSTQEAPQEPAQEIKPALPATPAAPLEAVRVRAEEERTGSLTDAMVKGLESARTTGERLGWLDAKEEQRSDVERFFASRKGKLGAQHLEASAGKLTLLPSGSEIKLYRLATVDCPEGAIVQVREDAGKMKLRWSLFQQSHDHTYDRFIAAPDGGDAAKWFHLLCRRSHSFELKGSTKDQWVCVDAQGSLTAAGTAQVYVNKDSPVGRFLDLKMAWGRVYLVELLLGKMELDGKRVNVALDCAGMSGDTLAK